MMKHMIIVMKMDVKYSHSSTFSVASISRLCRPTHSITKTPIDCTATQPLGSHTSQHTVLGAHPPFQTPQGCGPQPSHATRDQTRTMIVPPGQTKLTDPVIKVLCLVS
jgi:hypothetical protein